MGGLETPDWKRAFERVWNSPCGSAPSETMACRRKPTIPDPAPDAGRVLVANGHGGSTTYAGLVYDDEDGQGNRALEVLGDVGGRSFRTFLWPADVPTPINTGDVPAVWELTGTTSVGSLTYTTTLPLLGGGSQVSARFPYSADWITQGWTPFVQVTAHGQIPFVGQFPFGRAVGGQVEVGVHYWAPVTGVQSGTLTYIVSLVALT
jgi:hypothetical protein